MPLTGPRVKASQEGEATEVLCKSPEKEGEGPLGVDGLGVASVRVIGVDGESHRGLKPSTLWAWRWRARGRGPLLSGDERELPQRLPFRHPAGASMRVLRVTVVGPGLKRLRHARLTS